MLANAKNYLDGESQCSPVWKTGTISSPERKPSHDRPSLNVVRSGRPEQFSSRGEGPVRALCLNVVRSGRPEQYPRQAAAWIPGASSQCSPVWKTGTISPQPAHRSPRTSSLNVVRSGRPEQCGLSAGSITPRPCLNVVRSGRPEQLWAIPLLRPHRTSLNVVRSGRPEQCQSLPPPISKITCLNVVRSGRPEQSVCLDRELAEELMVSM